MCQQSLISYISKHLIGKVKQEDIEEMVYRGDLYNEINQVIQEGKLRSDNRNYQSQRPKILLNMKEIDKLLKKLICDLAIGPVHFQE